MNEGDKQFKQFIVFTIGDQTFGVNVLKSREILAVKDLTVIPDTPGFVEGVIDLRGEIVPVIDLAKRFSLNTDGGIDNNKIVITSIGEENLVGIKVDEVNEIVRIDRENIAKTPEITKKVDKEYIRGVAKLKDRLLVLLDLDKVFSQEEIKQLNEI